MLNSLASYRSLLTDGSFDLSDLSEDGITCFAACLQEADAQTCMDFGTTDEVNVEGWSKQKLGGHLGDLIEKGYLSGEYIRVNNEGPRFFQYTVEEKFQEAVFQAAAAEVEARNEEAAKPAFAPVDPAVVKFTAVLDDRIASAEGVIAKFKANLETNPEYAFQWSSSAMEAAADLALCTYVRAVFADEERESPVTMTDLQDHLRREVERMASSPSFSTSVPSNLMDTYKLKATTELLRKSEGRWL